MSSGSGDDDWLFVDVGGEGGGTSVAATSASAAPSSAQGQKGKKKTVPAPIKALPSTTDATTSPIPIPQAVPTPPSTTSSTPSTTTSQQQQKQQHLLSQARQRAEALKQQLATEQLRVEALERELTVKRERTEALRSQSKSLSASTPGLHHHDPFNTTTATANTTSTSHIPSLHSGFTFVDADADNGDGTASDSDNEAEEGTLSLYLAAASNTDDEVSRTSAILAHVAGPPPPQPVVPPLPSRVLAPPPPLMASDPEPPSLAKALASANAVASLSTNPVQRDATSVAVVPGSVCSAEEESGSLVDAPSTPALLASISPAATPGGTGHSGGMGGSGGGPGGVGVGGASGLGLPSSTASAAAAAAAAAHHHHHHHHHHRGMSSVMSVGAPDTPFPMPLAEPRDDAWPELREWSAAGGLRRRLSSTDRDHHHHHRHQGSGAGVSVGPDIGPPATSGGSWISLRSLLAKFGALYRKGHLSIEQRGFLKDVVLGLAFSEGVRAPAPRAMSTFSLDADPDVPMSSASQTGHDHPLHQLHHQRHGPGVHVEHDDDGDRDGAADSVDDGDGRPSTRRSISFLDDDRPVSAVDDEGDDDGDDAAPTGGAPASVVSAALRDARRHFDERPIEFGSASVVLPPDDAVTVDSNMPAPAYSMAHSLDTSNMSDEDDEDNDAAADVDPSEDVVGVGVSPVAGGGGGGGGGGGAGGGVGGGDGEDPPPVNDPDDGTIEGVAGFVTVEGVDRVPAESEHDLLGHGSVIGSDIASLGARESQDGSTTRAPDDGTTPGRSHSVVSALTQSTVEVASVECRPPTPSFSSREGGAGAGRRLPTRPLPRPRRGRGLGARSNASTVSVMSDLSMVTHPLRTFRFGGSSVLTPVPTNTASVHGSEVPSTVGEADSELSAGSPPPVDGAVDGAGLWGRTALLPPPGAGVSRASSVTAVVGGEGGSGGGAAAGNLSGLLDMPMFPSSGGIDEDDDVDGGVGDDDGVDGVDDSDGDGHDDDDVESDGGDGDDDVDDDDSNLFSESASEAAPDASSSGNDDAGWHHLRHLRPSAPAIPQRPSDLVPRRRRMSPAIGPSDPPPAAAAAIASMGGLGAGVGAGGVGAGTAVSALSAAPLSAGAAPPVSHVLAQATAPPRTRPMTASASASSSMSIWPTSMSSGAPPPRAPRGRSLGDMSALLQRSVAAGAESDVSIPVDTDDDTDIDVEQLPYVGYAARRRSSGGSGGGIGGGIGGIGGGAGVGTGFGDGLRVRTRRPIASSRLQRQVYKTRSPFTPSWAQKVSLDEDLKRNIPKL